MDVKSKTVTPKRRANKRKQKQACLNALLNEHVDLRNDVLTLAAQLFRDIDTPTSLGLFLCLKHKDWPELVSHSVNPNHYLDHEYEKYYADHQACKLLAKYKGLPSDPARLVDKAEATFWSGERDCLEVNQTFEAITNNASFDESLNEHGCGRFALIPEFQSVLRRATEIVHELLGPLDIEEWLDNCRFGPGKSYGVPGTSDYSKLGRSVSCTDRFLAYAPQFLAEFPGWCNAMSNSDETEFKTDIVVTRGEKYAQVSKDAKTNRNIATQPSLNLFAQRGLGLCIKRRLKEVAKIDTENQQRNQQLAKEGSIHGKLCTIDLSNASDTISLGLVKELLPPDWFFALDLVRCDSIEFKKLSLLPLEKFSAMGNGFTFELETLLFYAICKAACEEGGISRPLVSVYGDDIIVNTHAYEIVSRNLRRCGFTVNPNKSYHSGVFRESCGADWFNGRNVRPFYIKEVPHNVASIVSLANGLIRSCERVGGHYGRLSCFLSAAENVRLWIPRDIRKGLAVGKTDDTVLYGDPRDGFRVTFVSDRKSPESWYQAVSTALYRQHIRRDEVEDDVFTYGRFRALGRSIRSVRGSRTPLFYSERVGDRARGIFKLEPVLQDPSWCLSTQLSLTS